MIPLPLPFREAESTLCIEPLNLESSLDSVLSQTLIYWLPEAYQTATPFHALLSDTGCVIPVAELQLGVRSVRLVVEMDNVNCVG